MYTQLFAIFAQRYVSGDLSPLISRLRDSFPPRGSLLYACANMVNKISGSEQKIQDTSRITKANRLPDFHSPALL